MRRSGQVNTQQGSESDRGSWRRGARRARVQVPLIVALLVAGILAAAVVSRQSRRPTAIHIAAIHTGSIDRLGASSPATHTRSADARSTHAVRGGAKAPTAAGTSAGRTTKPAPPLSSTTTAPIAVVAAMGTLHDPSAIVTLAAPITGRQLLAVQALKSVAAVDVVDVGTVAMLGAPAVTIGVDPGTFRDFTPSVTASADRLWQYISTGTLASSFDMSRDRKLTLGVEVPVTAAGTGVTSEQYLGAFMSVGLPGIDLVVSRHVGAALGLAPSTGVIVSAPTADPVVLQTALRAVAPGASVVLMRPGLALGTSGSVGGTGITTAQLSTALTAALSRVGKPYVWGGTGPNGFDCSGLVGWSFASAGISLPRTAAGQALAGPAVPLNQLQPGDLLFWAYDPGDATFIDHVAIYLGGGQMIEAPQTGSTVHVIPLHTGNLVGAVRVNPTISARLGSPWRQ